MALDPQAKAFLDIISEREPTSSLTPEQNRARLAENTPLLAGAPEAAAQVEDRLIPAKHGEIKIRVYTPEGKGPFPVFVYFHGGGWVMGDLETADVPCRSIAKKAGCIVVSVDYRLAPESKFPAAVEDAYTAVSWVAGNAEQLRGDGSRIAVGGDSAGGNLATVVTIMAREQGGPSLVSQILIYPVTDFSFDTRSMEENADGYFLTRDSLLWFADHYLRDDDDKRNVYAAPLLARDLSRLPPALIITAEFDPLRDGGAAYAARLKEAGVPVEYDCYAGMIHGFFWMPGIMDKGKQVIEQVAHRLRSAFEPTDPNLTAGERVSL